MLEHCLFPVPFSDITNLEVVLLLIIGWLDISGVALSVTLLTDLYSSSSFLVQGCSSFDPTFLIGCSDQLDLELSPSVTLATLVSEIFDLDLVTISLAFAGLELFPTNFTLALPSSDGLG